jgi:hypothetical protein
MGLKALSNNISSQDPWGKVLGVTPEILGALTKLAEWDRRLAEKREGQT